MHTHQAQIAASVRAIAAGEAAEITDILAAVTPGGGKSLLPVIAAHTLLAAGMIDRVCWVVPRDSLRLQAEEAFVDPTWRATLSHAVAVRAAENAPDPCRGLQGYITTYQSVAAAPDLHLAEFRRHRMLLVVDEVHHLPALSDMAPDPLADPAGDAATGWSRALLPLMETARLRMLLSGTLQRADSRSILWLPYRSGPRAKTREVDLAAPGWAVVGYSRSQALAERAVLPVLFGAVDGEATWLDESRIAVGPHRLFSHWPTETTRPALFTALRTGFADQLLREAFTAARILRADRRRERGLAPGEEATGLGKLLVVAPDQVNARRYADTLRGWIPAGQGARRHRIPRARYRVTNWPAYEAGLRRRGNLTFWLDETNLVGWVAPKRSMPGGQPVYTDLAIELVLTLRLVFHLALRQAEAFARSVLKLLESSVYRCRTKFTRLNPLRDGPAPP